MDKRILTLGKFYNKYTPNFDSKGELLSECYFNWVDIVKVSENIQKSTADKIFSHKTNDDNIFPLTCESKHTQESMTLVSDIDDDFLDSPSFIYISMINLPMWSESAFDDKEDYIDVRQKIYKIISETMGTSCKLYHTFDHCDLILLADGKKISFSDYITTLKSIRKIVINTKKSCVKAILDITTIYGYTHDGMKTRPFINGYLSFVLELSFKNLECKYRLLNSVKLKPDFVIETVGRYDTMMFWKNKDVSFFEEIVSFLHNNFDDFFAYKIILGSEIAEEKTAFGNDSGQRFEFNTSQLTDVAIRKFGNEKKIMDYLSKESLPLYNAIVEIQNSILTMLGSGFAQYYTLSFYESFYSFIEYIIRMFDRSTDVNSKKAALEKTYELFKAYFGYLNALNACTIHSERQFLQTDSYQLLYFDAAPKIITFYTAVANKIVSVIENNSDNNYTFLITPDFKKDIFVESITDDHTLDHELNILIIHVNEHSLYDIPTTLRIITHEIFHHIGQSTKLRIIRARLFVKCFVAYIFSHCIPREVFDLSDSLNSYDLLKKLVNVFFETFFNNEGSDSTAKLFKNRKIEEMKYKEMSYTVNQESHYYMYFVNSFINDINELFSNITYDDLKELLSGILCKPLKQYANVFGCPIDDVEQFILTDFSNSYIAENVFRNICAWLSDNSDNDTYNLIRDAFRESFADLYMINLFCNDDNIKIDKYLEMMFKGGKLVKEEDLRIYPVVETLRKDDDFLLPISQKIIKAFKKRLLFNNDETVLKDEEIVDKSKLEDELKYECKDDVFLEKVNIDKKSKWFYSRNFDLFSCYLVEQVSEYLKICNKEMDDISNIDKLYEDLFDMVYKFEAGTVGEIVEIMDKEIYEYRLRLISGGNYSK